MRILCTRKTVWILTVVLLVVGLGGAFAQGAQQTKTGLPASAADKPKEVPLGSGSGAALPSLDLQVSGDTGGSASGSMMAMEMGMEMNMKSPMAGMGSGGISVKESEVVQVSPPMGPMAGMGNMAGMNGMGPTAAPGGELSQQLLATNALLTQLLATLASQPGGLQAAQLQTVNQLLANQAALLQLLLKSGAGAPAAASAAMPSGGMGMGMGMMGMGGM